MNFDNILFNEGTTYGIDVTKVIHPDNDGENYLLNMIYNFIALLLYYFSSIKVVNYGIVFYYILALIIFIGIAIWYYCK